MPEAVALPFYTTFIDSGSGSFNGTDAHAKAGTVMLDELARWTTALRVLR